MASDLILRADKRCAACHEMMKAGSPFRWFEKSVYSSSKVGAAGKTVYRPAHADSACVLSKFEREGADRVRQAMENTIAVLRRAGVPEAMIGQIASQVLVNEPLPAP